MRNLLLVSALLMMGYWPLSVLNAQTLNDISRKYMGHKATESRARLMTDYGEVTVRFYTAPFYDGHKSVYLINKVLITLSNLSNADFAVQQNKDYQFKREGTHWTDYYFEIEPLNSRKFDTFEEASKYYWIYKNASVDKFTTLQLFKHVKKTIWLLTLSPDAYIESKKWELVNVEEQ